MRYAAILSALIDHLRDFPGWQDSDCAWPDRPFSPGSAGFWKVDLLPTGVDSALGATGNLYERGVFQVSRFEPAGKGAGIALAQADLMGIHLDRKTLTVTGVTVALLVPSIAAPIQEPNWLQVPVSVSFIAS